MTNSTIHYTDDNASLEALPLKSFFVSMLTRDIQLEDAILDLLDNCVDGILRSNNRNGIKPYRGYKAEIEFGPEDFTISDNCGGIPWDLHEYAFRMGPPPSETHKRPSGSVGVYGIGMKRALFKLGRHCLISTRNAADQYEVEIDSDWMASEENWRIPVRPAKKDMEYDGTTIYVSDLHPGIMETFGPGIRSFSSVLYRTISSHYAYIIEKGFEVTINGKSVIPRTTKILFDEHQNGADDTIKPFVFESNWDGVEVYLAVGFTRPIPSENEIKDEQEAVRYSSVNAGWTILCNDRAVVHSDRTELTGWGEANVPRYHTQFIAISGIVEFKSEDPSKLPTTTTKRGIDSSNPLYLQVKNKMREGMRVFTSYTNRWKGQAETSKQHFVKGSSLSFAELRQSAKRLTWNATRTLPPGKQHKPELPRPPRLQRTHRRISFVKNKTDIQLVADYLGDSDMPPGQVGENCFEIIFVEAGR